MLTLLIVLIAVVVVLTGSTTFVVVGLRRRRRLRPTSAPPVIPPGAAPTEVDTGTTADGRAPPASTDTAVDDRPSTGGAVLDAPPTDAPAGDPEAAGGPAGPDGGGSAAVVAERPRFRDRLGKARNLFAGYITAVRLRERIDATTWDDLEEALILADVGVEATASLLDDLRGRVKKEGITSPSALIDALKADMVTALDGDRTLRLDAGTTNVWLVVGVNGVGKTTTIGKLGSRARGEGRRVVMAAGDTFRAAAADQLSVWAERVGAEVVRGNEGGDPGAVIFDAVQHASARHVDLVLADTAGRLHTKVNLMEELKKVRRVAGRPPGQVSEVLLVIDATTGQNGLIQAKQFTEAVDVTGVVLTKLDGTAKGGIALAITAELGIPIKLVGLGEGEADLIDFDPSDFVDALVGADDD